MNQIKFGLQQGQGAKQKPGSPPALSQPRQPGVMQSKMATPSQAQRPPVAPPVYRPQPSPTVSQAHMASGRQAQLGHLPRQPVAAPVYRPEQKGIMQPKIANGAQAHMPPNAAPIYRPQPTLKMPPATAIIQQKTQQQGGQPRSKFDVVQLGRPKRSNRIASIELVRARKQRDKRAGRNEDIVRFVPGGKAQTRLEYVAGLGGGKGLICPVGSFVRVKRNFVYQGSRAADFAALGGTPAGMVWHHAHDFVSTGVNTGKGSMYLLPIGQHRPGHRGGVWQFNNTPGNTLHYI
jgi:hypothetical protein